jgi:serine/threonine protein kinase
MDPAETTEVFSTRKDSWEPGLHSFTRSLRAAEGAITIIGMLETIGHYRIRRKIGEGGMGVVYEGWDERLQRAVAIKTIHEASGSRDTRSRLWREARSLARVNHPRVCQVFDVLEDGEALVLILELLDGQSLADRLLGGVVTTSDAVGIERQILEAPASTSRRRHCSPGPQTF